MGAVPDEVERPQPVRFQGVIGLRHFPQLGVGDRIADGVSPLSIDLRDPTWPNGRSIID